MAGAEQPTEASRARSARQGGRESSAKRPEAGGRGRAPGRHQRPVRRRQEPGEQAVRGPRLLLRRQPAAGAAGGLPGAARRRTGSLSTLALVLDIRAGDPAAADQARAPALAARRAARAHLPGGERRGAGQPFQRDAPPPSAPGRAAACRPASPRNARRLAATRELADHVIDTSGLSIGQLKERLFASCRARPGRCGPDRHHHLRLQVRHPAGGGPRLRCSLPDEPVLGARAEAALRAAGAGARVRPVNQPAAKRFLDLVAELLELTVPAYRAEGRERITVALGCTGGYHRSIALAEELAARLAKMPRASVAVFHRELER